jgi:hypothetical protein
MIIKLLMVQPNCQFDHSIITDDEIIEVFNSETNRLNRHYTNMLQLIKVE